MKPLLSVIVPVFNEEKTILQVIKKIRDTDLGINKEIIVVNDGSTDSKTEKIAQLKGIKGIVAIKFAINRGKGSAIREGIKHSSGTIITIHDADLEYDTKDLKKLIEPISKGEEKVVYGSRFLKYLSKKNKFYFGNRFLSAITSLLFLRKITDMETCYKVLESKLLKSIHLTSKRFEFEPELTAKVLKRGINIREIPISYSPRNHLDGKKIKPRDGLMALWTLLKVRFS